MCIRDSPPPDPPEKRLRRARRAASLADSAPARKAAQSAPPRSFGDQIEVLPGPAQFKFRTPEASLHFPLVIGRSS
eukprot:6480439-Alexandrium_andersonii.AAC.1